MLTDTDRDEIRDGIEYEGFETYFIDCTIPETFKHIPELHELHKNYYEAYFALRKWLRSEDLFY